MFVVRNLRDHWLVRTHVIYPNLIVALFLFITVMHVVLYIATDLYDPFWGGLAIGIFSTIALSELGLRYRVHKYGRA